MNKAFRQMQSAMKTAVGERGEELDKEKYKALISEYREFKSSNVKHFRFSSEANKSEYSKLKSEQCDQI